MKTFWLFCWFSQVISHNSLALSFHIIQWPFLFSPTHHFITIHTSLHVHLDIIINHYNYYLTNIFSFSAPSFLITYLKNNNNNLQLSQQPASFALHLKRQISLEKIQYWYHWNLRSLTSSRLSILSSFFLTTTLYEYFSPLSVTYSAPIMFIMISCLNFLTSLSIQQDNLASCFIINVCTCLYALSSHYQLSPSLHWIFSLV